VLAFLRTNLTYAELAAANRISRSTCRRIINEVSWSCGRCACGKIGSVARRRRHSLAQVRP
jgi:hypothetical protein